MYIFMYIFMCIYIYVTNIKSHLMCMNMNHFEHVEDDKP